MACPRTKPYPAGGPGTGRQLCCTQFDDEAAAGEAGYYSVRGRIADADENGGPDSYDRAVDNSFVAGYARHGDNIGSTRSLYRRVPGRAVAAV